MSNLVRTMPLAKEKKAEISRTSLEVLLSPLRLLPNPPEPNCTQAHYRDIPASSVKRRYQRSLRRIRFVNDDECVSFFL